VPFNFGVDFALDAFWDEGSLIGFSSSFVEVLESDSFSKSW
jgi:hypothetical protein